MDRIYGSTRKQGGGGGSTRGGSTRGSARVGRGRGSSTPGGVLPQLPQPHTNIAQTGIESMIHVWQLD